MIVLMTDTGAWYCPLSLLFSTSSFFLDCLLQKAGGKLLRESGDILLGLLQKSHIKIKIISNPALFFYPIPFLMDHLYPLNGL